MIKLIKYILYLVIVLGLVLTLTPLNLYYKHIEKELRPVQLQGISGSAIKGSSEQLSYMGMNLGQAEWLIYPNSYDSILAKVSLEDENYDIRAEVVQNPKRRSINNVRGTIDWKSIERFVNFRHGEIQGYLSLDLNSVAFENGVPERIEGRLVTRDLKLIKPLKKDLGEIEVSFNADAPGVIVGTVNSQSSVINVSGAIYIHKNHRWEIKLNIIPQPGEYELEYALQGIGDRRRGGGRTLNLAGFY